MSLLILLHGGWVISRLNGVCVQYGVRVHFKIVGNVVEETKVVVTEVQEELHLQILCGAVEAAWCCGAALFIGRGV